MADLEMGLSVRSLIARLWPLAVFAAAMIGNWTSTSIAAQAWSHAGRYSHGWLIVAMFASATATATTGASPRPTANHRAWRFAGLVLAALSTIGWCAAVAFDVRTAAMLLSLLTGLSACVAISGEHTGTRLILPTSLLVYALPIWEPVSSALQSIAIFAVGLILNVIGLPAVMDGALVLLADGTLEIAEGCSGVSYFLTATAVGTYIAATHTDSRKRSPVGTILAFAALGILANWIRIVLLAVIAHVSKMQAPVVHDHYWFGWMLFGCALLPAVYAAASQSVSTQASWSTEIREHLQCSYRDLLVACASLIFLPPLLQIVVGKLHLGD